MLNIGKSNHLIIVINVCKELEFIDKHSWFHADVNLSGCSHNNQAIIKYSITIIREIYTHLSKIIV